MDAMPQSHGYALPDSPLPVSVATLLRPITLDHGDSFSSYFSGMEGPILAGAAPLPPAPQSLSPVLAQQFDQDILGDMVSIWNNFVESGQIWALLFGIVLGYMIRNLTAY
jgi:hypothetical protein